MKKLFFVSLLIACLHTQAQLTKPCEQLKVQGTNLLDAKGNRIALHGMSLGWHNWWPRFYNAATVHELVNTWHANMIRAAMGVEPDGGYLKNPEGSIRLVKNVVDACIKENAYVIIDWHDHNIHLNESKLFFEKMAKEYGKYPNVIYEIYNEPDHESWAEVKSYSEQIIKTIRAQDPDNIILVGSPHWDQDINLAAADPIKGYDNLMYTMHFYAGTHKKWLRDRTDDAIANGLPIFVSECAGMEASGDGPVDITESKNYFDWMDAKGLSWAIWSVSDKNESCSVLNPSAPSDGHWKNEDIKEWGKMAMEYLGKYKEKK
jgi:endoglucanase